jgi:uncharacterized protein
MTTLTIAAIAFGALVGGLFLYVAILVLVPGRPARQLDLPAEEPRPGRQSVSFTVDGQQVRAWLYLPDDAGAPVPCVVMSHGFGGTRDMGLEPFAMRYREAGLAALTYDYRHFGASEGEPRQHFSMKSQLDDCRRAIAFARDHERIDGDRIALWGTSAGGGYGLVLAAQDDRIAAVSAQCAALDGKADSKLAIAREGYGFFIKLIPHAQRDKGRSRLGLSPHTIPIVARPGERALFTAPGAYEGYLGLAPEGFVNEICARLMLTHQGDFNPIDHAHGVRCPTLIQVCLEDNLVSRDGAHATAERIGATAELIEYPLGHFEIYTGEGFEAAVTDQVAFFTRHLLG